MTLLTKTIHPPSVTVARNINFFVDSLVSGSDERQTLNDPAFYIRFLEESFIPFKIKVTELKRSPEVHEQTAMRFQRLIEALSSSVPALPVPIARQIGAVADAYMGNMQDYPGFGADVAWHFNLSSTLAKQGRQLYTVVRCMRPELIVEAGTAYGMSGLFLMNATELYTDKANLHTIEGFDPQFTLSSNMLDQYFGDRVHNYKGLIEEMLPKAVEDAGSGKIDLFTHDAGHSYDCYVKEFGLIVDHIKPGGIVLIDDINWEDARFYNEPTRCYEGWREIASHPRVADAVELDGSIGMLRLV